MIRRTNLAEKISNSISQINDKNFQYDGNISQVISTGSTLLDLAISGGRIRGGGLLGGIMVEIFGPSGSGKTVMLCEIAGNIQRLGGGILFHDPEARLNTTFARLFDLQIDEMDYTTPDTIPEVFSSIRNWQPNDPTKINGIMADSLAALSTNLEMDNQEGDKMGMRRAKEFSEELRKTARILKQKNYLLVASNQVRINANAGMFGQKYVSPGGEAIGFYSSVRLKVNLLEKIKKVVTIKGKQIKKVIGVTSRIQVFKNSVWAPYREADLTILFDYGIDDIRENLKFIKQYNGSSVYTFNGENLDRSLEKSIQIIEENGWEKDLREQVIDLWELIEKKFASGRKKER